MISVTYFKDSADQFIGFEVSGHAGAGEYGHDIVCATVSVLVINMINSVEEFTDDDFICDADESSGLIKLMFQSELSNESKLLLDSMMLGIEGIWQDNEEYIEIVTKEV